MIMDKEDKYIIFLILFVAFGLPASLELGGKFGAFLYVIILIGLSFWNPIKVEEDA